MHREHIVALWVFDKIDDMIDRGFIDGQKVMTDKGIVTLAEYAPVRPTRKEIENAVMYACCKNSSESQQALIVAAIFALYL